MTPQSQTSLTSYLLGNLHCPSCVAAIRSLLADTYGDKIKWVSPNLVTSVVTVEHLSTIPGIVQNMAKTLEDVGFDVCAVDSSRDSTDQSVTVVDQGDGNLVAPQRGSGFEFFSWLWRPMSSPSQDAARAAHLKNCHSCRSGQDHHDDVSSSIQSPVSPNYQASATAAALDGVVTADGAAAPSGPWRATLSVGGMTCAVCTNTITNEMEKLPWVSRVVVNLVANSAVVDFTEPDREQDIVEGIQDLGYEATLDNVQDLGRDSEKQTDAREVEIKIDGIFCPRCPDRIYATMKSFGTKHVDVLNKPTINRPLLKVRYTPASPTFTIRHILKAIEATDPSLHASIYHPPTLEERSRAIRAKHQRALLWRMILALIIAVPTLILGIVYMSLVPDSDPTKHYLMKPWVSGLSRMEIILFALSTPVYFFGADIFHTRAMKEVWTMWKSGSRTSLAQRFYKFGSMNLLISLGTTIAYFSSIAQMIAAAVNHDMDVPADRFYFDSVVFLTLFLLAGRMIEAYSKSKTGSAVVALAKLRPNTALLVEERAGSVVTAQIPLDQLEHGDVIRVPHGASPAADGTILTGESNFDESSLTGESRPIKKIPGDEVFAGTVNKGSAITIRATGTSGKSMLDQIVEVVREGQTKRAPVEQIADLMTSYFVPVVTLIAVITWIVWLVLVQTGKVSGEETDTTSGRIAFAFQFAIAVFVVACPCGLGLAAPTAIFVGGGIAANHGILVKGGGEAFEKASRIDCVVFDKTGTLTVGGEPQITDSAMLPEGPVDVPETTILSGLKAIEENSTHPIAKAIVAFCGTERSSADLEAVEEVPGKGMKAAFKSSELNIAVGNEALMRSLDVNMSDRTRSTLETWKREAKSVALVAIEKDSAWRLATIMAISDPIRDETVPVIKALQQRGTQVWMLSGDNLTTARAVAHLVGIPSDHVLAEVLPSEKADRVRYLQATAGGTAGSGRAMVAMVGDGVNDAPALTTADVGVAIGSGSDVAISSADFVLAGSRLTAVPTLLDLSRVVFRRIKMNFGWAIVYNMVALPIAAGCLYAVRTNSGAHIKLDPVWASLAMALSSLSVVLSSLSLRSGIPFVSFRAKRVGA
ncbi:ATPase, P-type, K/Mg/Cd/Cu/Zn/Na/Ca/Na/H-transporter [Cordyceps fumosorosea ARSEF 2679]|uniref:ATPase, P-type, K/Mg/Cd/Cu/Zn/Na/Ca/Na/H-transporter n=1 Tax=Cordyceps fumosorosea (strain ARSEF 2679) TaxID=1081104 RepID=A0A162MU86_CORFA|nr:ATPase, P-type, K/Mg/Cd/Cu/Zn/Na/Ca/Na/H-transporter [Cordyceps fumosorosea ARSEF 2679]OAA70509.1 ATPase, P-type, K/Mg/Cd/Cu/Zn/Na/Ca/Na/H-transporter [Cordyceps fumosorosea ARSEF 2679]